MSTANQTEVQIPFDQMNAEDWCKLLCKQPRFANRCPWEKLDESNCRKLLCRQPQFAMNKPFRGENDEMREEKRKLTERSDYA